MYKRHRKLRNSSAIRNLVKNIYLEKGDLIYPIFIEEGENVKREISSMPGIFRYSIEEVCIASNANIGGPTTAAALAIARGWNQLVVPAMLVGILGYVIGNYYGVFIGNILKLF